MTIATEKITAKDLAKYIDHTLLKPEATKVQILRLCEEALQNHFYGVCVNSGMISTCCEILKNTKIKIVSVVGFPLGACETSVKTFEASRAFNLGAHEVDMVLNISALKARDYQFVEKEIASIVHAAGGQIVKVILETFLLTDEEKVKACELAVSAGAHFVKTSTGFGGGGASVADILLMKKSVAGKALVKASGGIKNYAVAMDLIAAGASRLGTSSGVLLVTGQEANVGY